PERARHVQPGREPARPRLRGRTRAGQGAEGRRATPAGGGGPRRHEGPRLLRGRDDAPGPEGQRRPGARGPERLRARAAAARAGPGPVLGRGGGQPRRDPGPGSPRPGHRGPHPEPVRAQRVEGRARARAGRGGEPLQGVPEGKSMTKRGVQIAAAAGSVVLLVVLLAWRYYAVRESTDDAQIDGHVNAVSARVGGTITEVLVQDNQYVKEGTPLVRIDPKDYEIAVARAEAD